MGLWLRITKPLSSVWLKIKERVAFTGNCAGAFAQPLLTAAVGLLRRDTPGCTGGRGSGDPECGSLLSGKPLVLAEMRQTLLIRLFFAEPAIVFKAGAGV